MRSYDEDSKEELKQMNAESWMAKALKMNPEYPFWGPEEDYMGDGSKYNEATKQCESKGTGWGSNIYIDDWKDFDISLDDLNEVVNFYFEVNRKSENCEHCEQSGLNPETLHLEKTWYDFEGIGERWCDNITQDEVEALQAKNRLRKLVDGKWQKVEGLTAEEVNAANRRGSLLTRDYSHDAINRWICVETRAKRLGVYGECEHCEGKGYICTAPKAHLELVLWLLHPRKGAARGVRVRNISKSDFNDVVKYLKEARARNFERFGSLKEIK